MNKKLWLIPAVFIVTPLGAALRSCRWPRQPEKNGGGGARIACGVAK